MWQRSQDPRLLIDLGTVVEDGERAMLSLECAPDVRHEVRVNFVLSVDGRAVGGGSGTGMFAPRNVLDFHRSGSGGWWMWGVVEKECVSVTCDGRQLAVLRQPLMNRDFFLAKVAPVRNFDLVFTSASGEQFIWSVSIADDP